MQHNSALAPPPALARCSIPILPVHSMHTRIDAADASSAESAASSLLLCVEYPGFVQSIPNALKRCKGEDSIRKLLPSTAPSAVPSAPSDSLLKLYLRPDDPSAPPLFGEVAHDLHRKPHASSTHATLHKEDADSAAGKATGATTTESFYEFVVKVTKKKNRRAAAAHSAAASSSAAAAAAASSSSLSAQLLGMISTSVTFPGLCDFQLLHAQRTPIVQMEMPLLTQPLDTPAAAAARALESNVDPSCFLPNHPGDLYALAPMIFSRYDYARDYGFAHHENTSAAAKSMQTTQPLKPKVAAAPDESGEEKEGASAGSKVPLSPLSGRKRVRKPAPAAASAASTAHAASPAAAVPAVAAPDDSEAEAAGGGGADDDEDDDAAAEGGGDDMSEAGGEKGGHVKRGRQARRFFITFALPTPAGPTAPELLLPELQSKPLVAQLRTLFQQRAICSTDYLLVQIAKDRARAVRDESKQSAAAAAVAPPPELSRSDLLHHLPCVAYRFSGGPWRNLWIRYGFDPRLASLAAEARRLQVVDYRVPRKLFEEIAEKQGQSTINPALHAIKRTQPIGTTGPAPMEEDTPPAAAAAASSSSRSVSPATAAAAPLSATFGVSALPLSQLDLHFDKMPLRLHSKFQLLDVRGEEIQQIVNDSELATTCDVRQQHSNTQQHKDRGWYLNSSLSTIRRLMTSRMHGWCVEQGLASASLLHTTAAASSKSKHSKRTLGRSFAAASFSVNNPMAASERLHKRSQKTAETKRKKKAQAEAEALATGIPIQAPPRKKRKKKGEMTEPAAAAATSSAASSAAPIVLPDVSPAVAASISAASVQAAAVVAQAAASMRGGPHVQPIVSPPPPRVPSGAAAAAAAAVYPLSATARPVFDVVHAAAAPPAATSAAPSAALSEGEVDDEEEDEDDDDDEGMEEE